MLRNFLCLFQVVLLHSVQLSWAQFVFDFQLHAVTTNGRCTGFFEGFSTDCETYLNRFCLREKGHPRSTDDSDCPLGSSERFGPGGNLPISRQILSSRSWQGGFQMFMNAYDEDIDFDDHLDNIFIEMELNKSVSFTSVREFTGEVDRIRVSMAFRVRMCPENLYGANCDTFCLAQNDDVNGHYICNSDGSIQCLPGFENTTNNCRDIVNPCDPTPCANRGNCTAMGPYSYTCECAPDYTGSTCEEVIDGCLEITCPNNSHCVNGSLCVCLPGFELSGDECTQIGTSADKPTVNMDSQVKIGAPVIIGSAIGGGVMVILVLFTTIVVMTFLMVESRKRSLSLKRITDGESSPEHMYTAISKRTLKLQLSKHSTLKQTNSMDDNPSYGVATPLDTPHPPQKNNECALYHTINSVPNTSDSAMPVSVAPNPIYGIDVFSREPQRSTIRRVENPLYGDPSNESTSEHVYSSPDQLLQTPPRDRNSASEGSGTYQYAYVKETSEDLTTTVATVKKTNGTSHVHLAQALTENEYAVIDVSNATTNVTSLYYDQLRHEPSIGKRSSQSEAQRMAENEELGYSALT